MDNILNLPPQYYVVMLLLNLWIFLIFPIIVIRKMNYLTYLLESQFDSGNPDEKNSEPGQS